MSEADAQLAAIRQAPDDDAPRLIYADWLDEQGQVERAEFIRLQILLARPEQLGRHDADEIVAAFLREEEILKTQHKSICDLDSPARPFEFDRGFAINFRGVFTCSGPNRIGVWTHLIFASDGQLLRIDSPHPAGELFGRARSYRRQVEWQNECRQDWFDGYLTEEEFHAATAAPPPPDRDDVDWSVEYDMQHLGPEFFQDNACDVSYSTFVLDPFRFPPRIRIEATDYRLSSDASQLFLEPINTSGDDMPSAHFRSFPES